MKRIVRFSENMVVIYEPENLTYDLQNARKSDYITRKASSYYCWQNVDLQLF